MAEKWTRYVKTISLKRVLEPLLDENILRLDAWRSWEEGGSKSSPFNWLILKESTRRSFEVHYLSLLDGPFSRSAILEKLDETSAVDAVVHELHYRVPASSRIGDRFASVLGEDVYRRMEFVAMFEWYPCRREPNMSPERIGRHKWYEQVYSYRQPEEAELGFEPAVLDLMGFLPLQVWKETIGRRVSNKYQEAVENFKTYTANIKGVHIKKILWAIFPRDMVSSREYSLKEEETWELVDIDRW